jgi:lipopolysaccharide export system protein LptA
MRLTIERLRIGIVVVAVLLLVALSLFFLVARYERRRLVRDLPEKLGIHIQSSAQGVTFEQSDKKGHVLFSIHAAKVVQYKGGGHAVLHDVSITLYGKEGSRADRIYGSAFEYDPVAGTARADGDVELDLQAPAPANSKSGGGALSDEELAKSMIHVKTSGLTFDKNTGVASTEKAVEFRFPQAAGKAVGASYDSGKGLLVLGSAVELTTSVDGNPIELHAGHAQFLRDAYQAFLLNVATEYQQDRSTAEEVILYFRPDSTVDHVDAKGNLHFTSEDGREISAQTGSLQMGDKNQPRTARLGRGVLFHSQDNQHQMRGTAVEAIVEFGDKGSVRHAQMRDAVTFVDQQLSLPDDPKGSATRQMRSHQLDVDFTAGPDRRSSPKSILATGDAAVSLHTVRTNGPQQNSTLQADSLFANLDPGMTISSIDGSGHARMTDVAADGSTMTSSGDALQVKFDQQGKKTPAPKKISEPKKSPTAVHGTVNTAPVTMLLSPSGATQIQTATLQGNVKMTQTPAKKDDKASPSPMVATAQRALYNGSDQVLRLDGSPRITDGSLEITAQGFEVARTTGDAVAKGEVKTTYQQGSGGAPVAFGGQGPAHIVADEARLVHATSEAVFRGQARLWQGTSSVSAPVIEISRTQQTLKAHADASVSKAVVNAAFMSPPSSGHPAGVVRLRSKQLVYSDAERKAVFHGAVVAEDGVATIQSDEVEVTLAPAQQAPGQKSGGVQAQVDKMTAMGHVVLEQAGRKGTGERLIYTGQTGLFILSGTDAAPPRLVDPQRGTVTGDSLIFNSRDDSVSVNGGKSSAVTETRVPR